VGAVGVAPGNIRRLRRAGAATAMAVACLLCAPDSGRASEAEALVAPTSPAAGEPFDVIVRTTLSTEDAGGVLSMASPRVQWPDFGEIGLRSQGQTSSSTRVSVANGRSAAVSEARTRVVTEEQGSYTVPEIEVVAGSESLRTEPFTFEVGPPGSAPALPSRGLQSGPPDWTPYLEPIAPLRAAASEKDDGPSAGTIVAIVVGAAVVLAAVVLGFRTRPLAQTAEATQTWAEPEDPRVAQLKRVAHWSDASTYYETLGTYVREELSARCGADTAGLAAEELIEQCRRAHAVSEADLAAAWECLEAADRAKFGAAGSTSDTAGRHLELARRLFRGGAASPHAHPGDAGTLGRTTDL
jgi:hypothetical protein